MKGEKIFRACDRHSVETMTLTKYVVQNEYMRKWMFEFRSKYQGRDIKIGRVN